ncbi:hypothetical protein OIU77_015134 [Salix suchowensis]|uniref:Uncharacterized protein n=1 Tax=Salix suchowensis TaxID=1278906 RepID=A0ABQ8ZU02_9ROSI|nr:hypothetical protein OIU77_015134 [Salix suchowensis]
MKHTQRPPLTPLSPQTGKPTFLKIKISQKTPPKPPLFFTDLSVLLTVMRKASTLASSVLSRTLTSTLHDGSALSTIKHRFLLASLFSTTSNTGSSHSHRIFNPFFSSLGVAGALVSAAATASLSRRPPA